MSGQPVTKPLYRLTGLFRGAILQSSFGAPFDPTSSHAQHSLPQLVSVEGSRCGRKLDRDRHPYRPSRGKVVTKSFCVSTFNAQSFQWDLLSQRHKLQHLILSHRKHQWDLMALSEMKDVAPEGNFHLIYIEEFLLIHKGRVAFLLPRHVYTLWIAQGCRWESPSSHVLGIHLDLMGLTYTFACVYIPTAQAFEQRRCRADVLEQARQWEQQSRSIHPDRVHVWAGDWNAHVGSDHPDQHGRCVGLNTPTTPAGVEQRRWLSQTNLQAVDSRFRVPGAHKWYELDYFCCDERILRQVQSLRVHHLGFSDHAVKQMLFHLSKPGATGRKNRRAAKSSRIRQEAALASDIPRPLLYDALRGPSEGSKKNRGEIQRRVHLELAQRFPECVDNCPSSSSSASPAPATPGMSIFTDGSCEVSVQRQG